MLQNYFKLPGNNELTKIYTGGIGDPVSPIWHTWNKPKGIKFVYIIAVGGGGGGRSGFAGTSTLMSGGQGGGQGGIQQSLILAQLLPDILYVNPGHGGLGGSAITITTSQTIGTNGANGGTSWVTIYPSTTNSELGLVVAGAGFGGGGGGGSGGGGSGRLNGLGFGSNQSGQTGATGGQGAVVGTNITAHNGLSPFGTAGAGGGGATNGAAASGGSIITVDPWPVLNGGASGGPNKGACGHLCGTGLTHDLDILSSRYPFVSFGGAGGGGNATSTGAGNGGDGGFGSGGGGGGAISGSLGWTSGAGGNGGAGFVIISCF